LTWVGLVTDEMLDAIGVSGRPTDVGRRLRERNAWATGRTWCSTTRRRPRRSSTSCGRTRLGPVARNASVAGTRTVKIEPSPTVLATSTVPPRSVTSRCTMCRPSPTPPKRRESEPSTWRNISKMTGSASGGIPTPVSATTSVSVSARHCARTVTLPACVNLSALPTRFLRIVFTFARSVRTGAPTCTSHTSVTPAATSGSTSRPSSARRAPISIGERHDLLASRLEAAEVERRRHQVEELRAAPLDADDHLLLARRQRPAAPSRSMSV
jgi:hypothetical protein